jgi:hypothetical protein
MQKVREEVNLEFVAQKSLNLELWLERYEDLKLGGYFVNFSGARDHSIIIFQKPGSGCKISDRGLISQISRGLCATFLN